MDNRVAVLSLLIPGCAVHRFEHRLDRQQYAEACAMLPEHPDVLRKSDLDVGHLVGTQTRARVRIDPLSEDEIQALLGRNPRGRYESYGLFDDHALAVRLTLTGDSPVPLTVDRTYLSLGKVFLADEEPWLPRGLLRAFGDPIPEGSTSSSSDLVSAAWTLLVTIPSLGIVPPLKPGPRTHTVPAGTPDDEQQAWLDLVAPLMRHVGLPDGGEQILVFNAAPDHYYSQGAPVDPDRFTLSVVTGLSVPGCEGLRGPEIDIPLRPPPGVVEAARAMDAYDPDLDWQANDARRDEAYEQVLAWFTALEPIEVELRDVLDAPMY